MNKASGNAIVGRLTNNRENNNNSNATNTRIVIIELDLMRQVNYFREQVPAFERLLQNVVIDDISNDSYCKKYLSHLLFHKRYYLLIYADMLSKLIANSSLIPKAISVIDYGAGNGLLGMFAKHCGFDKVWINDIDEKFIIAAKVLAAQLDINIDGFILGDILAVQNYLKDDTPTAITGADVIEHIYDLRHFFHTLKEINPAVISVFSTGSNPVNFLKVRQLKKLHIKDELQGGKPRDNILFGHEPIGPYLKIREQMIREYPNTFSEEEIIELSKATRGLDRNDIRSSVKEFINNGKWPVPADKTNTCNPYSGSWTERILSFQDYRSTYNTEGFTCDIYPGFYNAYQPGKNNFVKKLLNAIITITGNKISPYIVIVGNKN
ncbi:MAG: class I SAM-dependent methyltransferase [Ferruginibacter sp.]